MKHTLRLAGAVSFAFISVACQGAPGALMSPTPPPSLGAAPATSSLLGVTWRLVEINGQKAKAGVAVTAVFGEQDRLAGSSGCNRYAGGAVLDNGRLTVGALAATRMYCGEAGVMEQEEAYLSALGKAAVYRVLGDELSLGPAQGEATLVFVRE